jgi:LEA14-like dessication related protein
VYDMLGNIVMNDVFTGKEQINQNYALTSLSKGVYIIEIRNEQQKAISRLVKQ